jgi:hypothetical protein
MAAHAKASWIARWRGTCACGHRKSSHAHHGAVGDIFSWCHECADAETRTSACLRFRYRLPWREPGDGLTASKPHATFGRYEPGDR